MSYAIAGDAIVARPFNAIKYIEHHKSNILTSASFTPPPHKSWLEKLFDKLIETLKQEGQP